MRGIFWWTVFGKQLTVFGKKYANSCLKFGILIVGEIEQQYFHQMLCDGNFLLGKKSLMR
jgi:hypothetical protein